MADDQLSGRETLRESIERIRSIPAQWKHLADPIGDLQRIREDPDYNPWENPQYAEPFKPCCEACDCDVPNRAQL